MNFVIGMGAKSIIIKVDTWNEIQVFYPSVELQDTSIKLSTANCTELQKFYNQQKQKKKLLLQTFFKHFAHYNQNTKYHSTSFYYQHLT